VTRIVIRFIVLEVIMLSSALLRSARETRGLTQRELAKAARIAQPRIADIESGAHDTTVGRMEQLLAPLGQRVTILPTRARPVWEAASALAAALEGGDEKSAWRVFIQLSDDLVRAEPALRVALCVAEPARTGEIRYDALLAGIVDHWLTSGRLPVPMWVRTSERICRPSWDVETLPQLRDTARRHTPPGLRRHGVYLAASELASV